MSRATPSIRRGRRTDFTATMAVLAAAGVPVPPPDRATLHRFRNIVADLGADFYVAVEAGTVVGVLHVTYNRRLTTAARAHVDLLCVTPAHRGRGVGAALLHFARRRASGRGCAVLVHDLAPGNDAGRRLLTRHGLQPQAETWVLPLTTEGADG